MTRLGVFGGSFDPPHRTHERVARAALDQLSLDSVLWIPAAHPPHKPDRTLTDDQHRMAMIQGVIADEPRFRLDTRELDRGGTSWTVRTLESLTTDHPDAALFLILGSDNLAGFGTWKDPERIAELATLVVYDRPEDTNPEARASAPEAPSLAQNSSEEWPAIHLDGARSDISSTTIRWALRNAEGDDNRGDASDGARTAAAELLRTHLHPRTLSYIRAHGLYLPI